MQYFLYKLSHSRSVILSFLRSLNDNHLDGQLPDAFSSLAGLINL
jgi:hypothetical protein